MSEAAVLPYGTAESFFEAETLQPVVFRLGHAQAAVSSLRCPEKETCNEDAAAIVSVLDAAGQPASVLLVADGCGGLASGELAARIAIDSVTAAVLAAGETSASLQTAILEGIESANRQVIALGIGAATTLVVAQVEQNQVRIYHVGDTQALQVGGRGKLKTLTKSHSPVGYALEAGVIDERQALVHVDRHLVSNIIGVEEMHVEVGPSIPLAKRDMLILATDGLWDNLLLDEIILETRKGNALHVATRLTAAAWGRMTDVETQLEFVPSKPDDLTLIAYSCR